ncbi:class I SAM-dependent methyltransferase [Arundinibacter roseus]|uniref:Class I SAM-dependent methyltransferase n=1 Tax=Arundinibacter roseus TaxID=2070510 RepID=A0A4R4JX04_9BACT|nr:class I SAM-dependent methyltransferase [Arundinibacter roseus]TDB58646.1 class I SAM-dependent methyltransferase [Arundinibacter roseus]
MDSKFPYLEEFSREINIEDYKLVKAFEIEKKFHEEICNEPIKENRLKLYEWVYSQVHSLYGKDQKYDFKKNIREKKKNAFLFKREFKNKSIIDIGCGDGALLHAISLSYPFKSLLGIDISTITPQIDVENMHFIKSDIVNFKVENRFDVAILDNVYEHISKFDTADLLDSITDSIHENGKVVFLVPNRLFGPWDVTRILDYTYSGITPSMGTHLNETTYTELIIELEKRGFNIFKTPIPLRKIKYLSFFLRFPAKWMSKIETSRIAMKLIKKIKFEGKPFFRFEVILIASKK